MAKPAQMSQVPTQVYDSAGGRTHLGAKFASTPCAAAVRAAGSGEAAQRPRSVGHQAPTLPGNLKPALRPGRTGPDWTWCLMSTIPAESGNGTTPFPVEVPAGQIGNRENGK